LRLSDIVDRGDIDEAIRLINATKSSISQDIEHLPESRSEKVYQCIHDISVANKTREVDMGLATEQCRARGFTNDEIEEAIEEFELNNMWQVNASRTKIIFV